MSIILFDQHVDAHRIDCSYLVRCFINAFVFVVLVAGSFAQHNHCTGQDQLSMDDRACFILREVCALFQ